ncbi:MAG: hypothetical protein GVY22_15805 [Gammaproteobacteria bacterium]|jgi:hypothetical protein|nr:hypothetical protein [Gammaproteobacteria bacterium]
MAHRHRLFPTGWPLYLAASILPFVLGVLIMQFFAGNLPGGIEALVAAAECGDAGAVNGLAHLGDRLTYGASFFIQVATCTVVLYLLWGSIRSLAPEARTACVHLLLLILAVGAGVGAVVRLSGAAAYALSYDLPRSLLLEVHGLPEAFAAGDFLLGQSRMFFAAAMPFLVGTLVVAFGAAAGAAESIPTDTAAPDWERRFGERFQRLQNAFRSSSLVLVTSAISLMLFLKLPAPLMGPSEGEAISRFASALTVYWGVVMTLTLLALFVPPYLAMRQEAISRHQIADTQQDLERWLDERQHRPLKRHLANLATLLAPVLVGPVGSLVQSVLGG